MDRKPSKPGADRTPDFLLAIEVGFLVNVISSTGLPEVRPFIAGRVAGVLAKTGPVRGALAGFLPGILRELVSLLLWVMTSLASFPVALLPYAFETTVAIITAISAVIALSGGIVGSVVSLQQGPRIRQYLIRHNLSLPLFHLSSPVKLEHDEL